MNLLGLLRCEQDGQCFLHPLEVVIGEDPDRLQPRAQRGFGQRGVPPLVEQRIDETRRGALAQAVACALESLADAEGDFEERIGLAGRFQGVLDFIVLATDADDLGELAEHLSGGRVGREFRLGEQPGEKLVAPVGDGTQNGRSNPRVCGIAPGDGGEGIKGAWVSDFAHGERKLETDASVVVGDELEEGVTQRRRSGTSRSRRGRSNPRFGELRRVFADAGR